LRIDRWIGAWTRVRESRVGQDRTAHIFSKRLPGGEVRKVGRSRALSRS
jgi:hypothetical protein